MAHVFVDFVLSICLSKKWLINMATVNLDIHALITFKGISCAMYAGIYTPPFLFAALRHWLEL